MCLSLRKTPSARTAGGYQLRLVEQIHLNPSLSVHRDRAAQYGIESPWRSHVTVTEVA